ncbi:MAG: AMP-binding protein [Myxococcales bacterium]|nr:AMP-binding protein [Myxococcales bacterium]MCB9581986.1 AMP-binding protein [Polyangiaceae bacterium]
MLDVTPFLEIKIAPRAVFDSLEERRTRPRFMLPSPDGDWTAITWGAFADAIKKSAAFLAAVGLAPGDRSAVFAPNRWEWAAAALGIQAAGGVMVPIYPACTADQAAYVAKHSDAKVIFVDTAPLLARIFQRWNEYSGVERFVVLSEAIEPTSVLSGLRGNGHALPTVGEVERKVVSWPRALSLGAARLEEEPGAFEERMASIDLDQPGLMLYTSGTTGNPKGVPLTHRNVGVNGLDWLRCNAPQLDESAVDVLWLPMSHIFGFGEVCLGNTLGFTSYLTDPANALELLPEVRPNVFMSVPAYWEKLAMTAATESDRDARRKKLMDITGGRLRFCLSGGAGLKREVKELFYDAGLLIIEGYGLTECSPTLTLNRPGAFRFDSVGQPLPSVELRLAEDGEILAKGQSVFSGYHKDEASTREAFTEDGWFKTGDVGRFTEDGFLQIVDRKKEILVTAGGKNVPPQNIELRFADEPLVTHAVVYGDGKKYLVAGIWLDAEAVDAKLAELGTAPKERTEIVRGLVGEAVERVNAELAKFEQIKKFRIMDTPLTVSGGLLTSTLKVRRKKVYETFGHELEALYEP